MALMSPEEFLEEHGPKTPETRLEVCSDLCIAYSNDYEAWAGAGMPKHGALYTAVLLDVAACKHYGCWPCKFE